MMFEDRIEITSPGGLPAGLSESEYLRGNVSILRNPILGNVFYRLHVVEILGTGILRINESYKDSLKKTKFEIFENSIKVTLPVISKVLDELSEDEILVYRQLSRAIPKSIGVISKSMPFGKSKTSYLLKRLCDKDFVSITGTGKATRYKSKY